MKSIKILLFCMILTLAMIVPILSAGFADEASVYAGEKSGEPHKIYIDVNYDYGYVDLFTDDGLGQAPEGEIVELEYHPNEGYHLEYAIFGSKVPSLGVVFYDQNRPVVNGQFEMPDEDVYILVRFVSDTAVAHTVTIEDGISNGSVSLVGSQSTFFEGETVEITVTPNEGYETEFVGYARGNELAYKEIKYNRFEMPNENVRIKANFVALPSYTIGASVSPAGSGTVTGAGTYYKGKEITLTATPATDYLFVNWTENGNVASTNQNYTFNVSGNRNLVANFRKIETYTITANPFPEEMGTVTGSGDYKETQTVTLTATPGEGYAFRNWTENGNVVSTGAEYSFQPKANRTLRANFYDPNATDYPLYVGGKQVTSKNAPDVFGDGTVKFEPASGDAPPTLTLNNYECTDYQINISDSGIIWYDGTGDFKVVLEGNNTLSYGDGGGVMQADGLSAPRASLVLTGSGTLSVSAGKASSFSYAINADSVRIDQCTIIAKGGELYSAGASRGIDASWVTINSGNVTATGGKVNSGVSVGIAGGVEINGGNVTATGGEVFTGNSEGIGGGYIEINGGTVTASAGDIVGVESPEQSIQGNSFGITSNDKIRINGGTVKASGGEGEYSRGIDCGINGRGDVYINKGISYVESTGKSSALWCYVTNSVSGTGWTSFNENEEETLVPINKDRTAVHNYKKIVFKPGRYSLTITAKDQTCPYDGKTHGPGDKVYNDPAQLADRVTVDGLQPGDSLESLVIDGQGKAAGNYPLTPSNAVIKKNDTDVTADYAITYVPGTLSITRSEPKPTPPKPSPSIDKAAAKIALDSGVKAYSSGNKVTASWRKVKGASCYVIYANYCGTGMDCKKIRTVSGKTTSINITKLNGKKLNAEKSVKFYVVAYRTVNGKKIKLAKSFVAHAPGSKHSKCTNVTAVKVEKASFTLKKGKTAKIKAELVLEKKDKEPLKHGEKFRYASSNKKVAKVNRKGKITAIGKGECTVYVYAVNGVSKGIKVTVK